SRGMRFTEARMARTFSDTGSDIILAPACLDATRTQDGRVSRASAAKPQPKQSRRGCIGIAGKALVTALTPEERTPTAFRDFCVQGGVGGIDRGPMNSSPQASKRGQD